jgi:plasmid stabilization system protein ParE
MAEVRWALTAEEDLQAIENFIAKDSVLHAVSFIDRLIEAVEQLAVSPKVGRVVPEFNREDLRELLFRAYRIVYQVRGETATVLRVVHGARDLARLMSREPWM